MRKKAFRAKYTDIIDKFKGPESDLAASLLEKYLKEYAIESVSDINTLKEVIYYEVVQTRFQLKLNDFSDNKSVPIQIVEIMHRNSDMIVKLKNSLGLFAEKEKRTEYDVLQHLKRRFKTWLNENQGSRTLSCPHCGKMILLKIRTDVWESQKHPFFRDKVLYNHHLIQLYKQQRLSKEDVAKVLECSPDYVEFITERVEKESRRDGQEKEKEELRVTESSKPEPTEISGADVQTELT